MKRLTLALLLAGSIVLPVAAQNDNPGNYSPQTLVDEAQKRDLYEPECAWVMQYAERNKQDVLGQVLLSKVLAQKGYNELSRTAMESAWRLNIKDTRPLFVLWKQLAEQGYENDFQRLVDDSAHEYRDSPEHLLRCALFLQVMRRYEQAAHYLQLPELQNSKDHRFLVARMFNELHLGHLRQAQELAAVLESDPEQKSYAAYVNSIVYKKQGRLDKALQYARQAHELKPSDTDALEAYFHASLLASHNKKEIIHTGLAVLAQEADARAGLKVKKALIPYLSPMANDNILIDVKVRGLTLGPTRQAAHYYFAVGDMLDLMDRPTPAVMCYAAGLMLEPSFGRAYMRIGRDLENAGHMDLALKCFRVAVKRNPKDREVAANFVRFESKYKNRHRDLAGLMRQKLESRKFKLQVSPEFLALVERELSLPSRPG